MTIKTVTKIRFLADEVFITFLYSIIALYYNSSLTLSVFAYILIVLTILDIGIFIGNKIYGK